MIPSTGVGIGNLFTIITIDLTSKQLGASELLTLAYTVVNVEEVTGLVAVVESAKLS